MSTQTKKIKRIFSAKISSSQQRQRPLSGTSAAYTRNQLIYTTYNTYNNQQLHTQRATSAKNLSIKVVQDLQKSKKIVVKQSKKKQQMQIQILHLKKTINQLVEDLQLQKGKNQSLRKKSQKYSKILTAEYDNQVHWNSNTLNTHLIAGIKNQYQNLKIKCQQLSSQNQKIKKHPSYTKQLQYIHYIQKLQLQNKTLSDKLKHLSTAGTFQILTSTQSQKKATDYIISQIQSQNRKLYQRNTQLKGKYKMCHDNLKDCNNKIAILEKLAIEKDNNYHALQKKQSQTKKQINTLRQKLTKVTNSYQLLQEQHNTKLQQFQQKIKQLQTLHTTKLNQIINDKNYKISSLQRQSQYFQNMVKELRSTNTQLNYQVQNVKMMKQTDRTIISLLNQNYQSERKKTEDNRKNSQDNIFGALVGVKKGVYQNNKRVQQKANKKYSQNAVKKRKINLSELQEIIQFLKLKLINKKINIKTLLDLFSSKQSTEWQSTYITLKQSKQIFQSSPLSLSPQFSSLLSRYLIQDVNQEYVYCDDNNQNNRDIVKSILKNLIKDIEHIDQVEYRKQADLVLLNYRQKLKNNLEMMEPSGYTTKKKFIDILKAIGVSCSNQAQDILLAYLVGYSSSINNLAYKEMIKE